MSATAASCVIILFFKYYCQETVDIVFGEKNIAVQSSMGNIKL